GSARSTRKPRWQGYSPCCGETHESIVHPRLGDKIRGLIVRTCLVTGGAGFIGSHLVEGLLQQGWQGRILGNFCAGKEADLEPWRGRVEMVRSSVTDPAAVEQAVRGSEVVFHLAALPSVARSVEAPLESHEACATGTVNVLDAARRAGVRRVVYAASSSAYGAHPAAGRLECDTGGGVRC